MSNGRPVKIEYLKEKLAKIGAALDLDGYTHQEVTKFGGQIAKFYKERGWIDINAQQFGEDLNHAAYCDPCASDWGYLQPKTFERLAGPLGFVSEDARYFFATCTPTELETDLATRTHLFGQPASGAATDSPQLDLQSSDHDSRVGVIFATIDIVATIDVITAPGQIGPMRPILQVHLQPLTVLRGVTFGFAEAQLLIKPKQSRGRMVDRWLASTEGRRSVLSTFVAWAQGTDRHPQWRFTAKDEGAILRIDGEAVGPLGRFVDAAPGDSWEVVLLVDPSAAALRFQNEAAVLPDDKTQIIENYIAGRLLRDTDDIIELRGEDRKNVLASVTIHAVVEDCPKP